LEKEGIKMSEKGWIIVAMWLAYGAGVVTVSLQSAKHGSDLGLFGALILAIATVRLFRRG